LKIEIEEPVLKRVIKKIELCHSMFIINENVSKIIFNMFRACLLRTPTIFILCSINTA
jgi:hypothetical protein